MLRRPARVTTAAALVAMALAGCGGGDDAATPLSPGGAGQQGATPGAATTTAPDSGLPATTVSVRTAAGASAADRAVIEGYRRFWQALGPAYTTGDVAALRAATTEPATGTYVRVASELRRKRQTLQGPVVLAPVVVGRVGGATLAECADLRKFRTYDNTGTPLYPEDEGLTAAEVRMRNVGGAWRVVSFEERPSGCRQQGG